MSDELKPCPFCGGKGEIERMGTGRVSMIIACVECGCRLETGETFISKNCQWNTRATPTIEPIDGLEEAIDILEVHMADMGDMAVVLVAARAYLKLMEKK